MCQAKVILIKNGEEHLVVEDVIRFSIDDGKVWLYRFFEEPLRVEAEVVEADFLEHTVKLRGAN
jgi:predicted RNA-binding protein